MWGSELAAIISLLFFTSFVQAANPLDVVINEIAWMGTENSYNDEWIELYNNTDSLISLDGWFIIHFTQRGKQGAIFNLSGTIHARGFYLLERTDDNSVPNITADKIYTGSLNNNGELLQLSDEQGTIIDLIDCIDGGWFAGDNETKQTMERISPNSLGLEPQNWQNSQNPGGTPKAKNSLITQTPPSPETESEEKPEIQVEPEAQIVEEPKPIIYPSGILINEILPSPEGPDEEEEWIEIFNQNNFEIELSDWRIIDVLGKITSYIFPEGTKISAQGFLVLSRPTTKITLNNDADGLNLSQLNGNIIDSVNYEKAPRGQSYNRIDSQWAWSTVLTPGSVNIIPSPISEIEEIKSPKKETKEPTPEKEKGAERELAAIGKQAPERPANFLFILLIALAIAIFSGIIVLILKKKVKNLDLSRKLE